MLIRSVFRTIKKSIGRYLAILAIIALGVGFFAGLRVSEKAMIKTADKYVRELQLYDFKLISTLGLTKEDVAAFKALDGVKNAYGSVSADLIYLTESGSDAVLHTHTLLDGANALDLTAGRLPEKDSECVIDAKLADEVSIGKKIKLSENNSDSTRESFKHGEYTVVGIANSPEYMNFERGTTSLGSGSVAGFMYILPEGFTAEYYTEIFLTLPYSGEIYSEKYDNAVEKIQKNIEKLLTERADMRYNEIYTEASDKIADAKIKLNDEKRKLEDAERSLNDGREKLKNERKTAETTFNAEKAKLDSAAAELEKLKLQLNAAADNPALYAQLSAAVSMGEKQYSDGLAAYNQAKKEAEEKFASAEKELKENENKLKNGKKEIADAEKETADAENKLSDIKKPTVYTLNRDTNIGYASLKNDTAIVSGVSKVFPVFFFLVAALVCITTITRMVSEQRTENGVLKALGFNNGAIAGQYLFYAGSASLIGCIAGFIIGSLFLPMALWQVYHIMYSISRPITFVLDWSLFTLCTLLYLICALGAALLVCRRDLRESAAQLIRPKSPASGKRIFLEHLPFIWKRMKFLHKVSARNIMRYKKRFVMMIIGIGGCTALLLTGFGVRDSIKPMVDRQFDEISLYDGTVSFLNAINDSEESEFASTVSDTTEKLIFLQSGTAKNITHGEGKEINLVVFENEPREFINLHSGGKAIDWPKDGEIVINNRYATENGISKGDLITLRDSDNNALTLKVSGIFENYIYDYAYVSAATYKQQVDAAPEINTAYAVFKDGINDRAAAAQILGLENVAAVSLSSDMRTRIGSMLDSLDYIVLIVLVCAGALAFIVLYNLTNITITERTREIATLKVLGFYQNEQNSYVFRENTVLTAVSALCGIPMGIALLNYVMAQIKINAIYFGCRLAPLSYLLSVLITFLFTAAVDLALTAKMKHINMAEALKAIE